MDETRVFFVTDGYETNEELFETLEDAESWAAEMPSSEHPRIRVCLVKHAYREGSDDDRLRWNYDDLVDTFETIMTLSEVSEDEGDEDDDE